jgi:hypothetical protein
MDIMIRKREFVNLPMLLPLRVALAAIMHEVAHFCRSVERACAGGPSRWIGVMPLAVRRV